MPPESLEILASENAEGHGVVEAYVYARLRQTVVSLQAIRGGMVAGSPDDFSVTSFLSAFDSDPKLKRSIDKAYEIVVHALFNAIATRVRAEVRLSVSLDDPKILEDFREFCELLLGVTVEQPSVTVPAKLYRVGGANSRDGGVDLWANFGPAIQVKYMSLKPEETPPIVEAVSADHMVIVCRDMHDKTRINQILKYLGLESKVRGIITKTDLEHWYGLALGPRHADDMATPLFKSLLSEFDDEFPLANPAAIDALVKKRGYHKLKLSGTWSVAEPVSRPKKEKSPKKK